MSLLDEQQKPPFNAEEIRILGCLMEKQLTTPNNYPLTMNALMQACNQKSSREPVMNLTEGAVGHATRAMIEFGWTTIQNSGRAQRVEHNVKQKLRLNDKQQAILAVLMLRQPQTLNEIKIRTDRMAEFQDVDEIQQILEDWLTQENPLVICLEPATGKRENRYYHALGTEDLETLEALQQTTSTIEKAVSPTNTLPASHDCCQELREKIEQLEARLAQLEALLE